MTKRISKRIHLSKETLRNLVPSELSGIVGGNPDLIEMCGVSETFRTCRTCIDCETQGDQCVNDTRDCLFIAPLL